MCVWRQFHSRAHLSVYFALASAHRQQVARRRRRRRETAVMRSSVRLLSDYVKLVVVGARDQSVASKPTSQPAGPAIRNNFAAHEMLRREFAENKPTLVLLVTAGNHLLEIFQRRQGDFKIQQKTYENVRVPNFWEYLESFKN